VSLLEIEHLDAFYGPVQVLHDLSFTVDEGAIVSILGANGAGKTTLLRAVSGLVKRIDENVKAISVNSVSAVKKLEEQLPTA